MEVITSEKIKKFILDVDNDLDELYEYVSCDPKSTIEGIFKALNNLLIKNYEQNKSRSDYLINILERIIKNLNDDDLIFLVKKLKEFDNNIMNNIKKKQRLIIKESTKKINNLSRKVSNKKSTNFKNSKINLLEYLIFQEKKLYLIEKNLNQTSDLLSCKNEDGDDIFSLVLNKYLYLNETSYEEIDYYFKVINLFIKSSIGNEILKNVERYQELIKSSENKFKKHIINLNKLLDKNYRITKEEIEKKYDVKFTFPNIILNEINTFAIDTYGRVDFTNQNCITIDNSNDKCLDDAIYIEKNQNGTYNLYIHIADVASFIPYDSKTDIEARKRIETQYLRDSIIRLYPEEISDCICSLLPNNNRNVVTSIYKLDSKYNLIDDVPNIVKGKIRTSYKLSYEEVDKHIKNYFHTELCIMLTRLFIFSLNQKRANPDKNLYRTLENYIESEEHHESLKIDYSPSANIVHEIMVLNNYGISKFFKKSDLPYLYRQLYIPSDNFINEQINKIKSIDESIDNERLYRNTLKESYVKAIYTSIPTKHKGLNLECYSHSSSPLRRYADAHGQYLIKDLIFDNKVDDFNIQLWESRTIELVKYLNQKKQENEIFSKHYNYLSNKKLIKNK